MKTFRSWQFFADIWCWPVGSQFPHLFVMNKVGLYLHLTNPHYGRSRTKFTEASECGTAQCVEFLCYYKWVWHMLASDTRFWPSWILKEKNRMKALALESCYPNYLEVSFFFNISNWFNISSTNNVWVFITNKVIHLFNSLAFYNNSVFTGEKY